MHRYGTNCLIDYSYAAILFSVVASAKRAGLDPFAYLPDLLRRLPSQPRSRIGELLPNVGNKFNIQSA